VGTYILMGHIKIKITPQFTGLNKTTQKKNTEATRGKQSGEGQSYVLKQMYFSMNDENAIT
jgi:hypothetical protein